MSLHNLTDEDIDTLTEGKAITPRAARNLVAGNPPRWVVGVWNRLVLKNLTGKVSSFSLQELQDRLEIALEREDPVQQDKVLEGVAGRIGLPFVLPPEAAAAAMRVHQKGRVQGMRDAGWFDLSQLFIDAGWEVEFDEHAFPPDSRWRFSLD